MWHNISGALCLLLLLQAVSPAIIKSKHNQSMSYPGDLVEGKMRLPGWNAFVQFNAYKTTLCTVPKVGSSAIRQWIVNLAPDQLHRCIEEIKRNNTLMLHNPACKSLEDFRNYTRFKKSGRTKFKQYCKLRLIDVSEFLFGKERCMWRTANYTTRSTVSHKSNMGRFFATFVRHPVDRFISWFVDKAVIHRDKSHIPKTFDFALLDTPDYGVRAMLKYIWKRREFFHNCSRLFDNHFLPQNCACLHRSLQYDFIGRLEDMKSDWTLFVDKMIETRISKDPSANDALLPRELPGQLNAASENEQAKRIRANLTMEDLQQIYEVYIDDFQYFNYDIQSWYDKQQKLHL